MIRNTSRYPDEEVSKLVRFALSEIDARGVCVNVKNSSATRRGRAYSRIPAISNAPADSRYLITIGIGAPERFPFEDGSYTRRNGEVVKRCGGRWPVETLGDWREALVSVAAHEAKHIEQFRKGMRRSEVECHHFSASRRVSGGNRRKPSCGAASCRPMKIVYSPRINKARSARSPAICATSASGGFPSVR